MTDTSHPELVYIDDILGEDGMAAITHEDGELVNIVPGRLVE